MLKKDKYAVILFGLILLLFLLVPAITLKSQNKVDSLTDELKSKVIGRLKNFSFGLYVDAYVNMVLNSKNDTSNIVPFSGNCPVQNQIRLNVAAVEVAYNAEKVRGKIAIQYGDAPNLLAAPNAQFIKNLRQANFGFRISPKIWVDMGYMLNPVGYESSWPVINQLSTVTVGGYFEPSNILGTKVSVLISEKFNMSFIIGNPYSLAYSKNTNLAGMVVFNFKPLSNFTITYNNFFGNQAAVNEEPTNVLSYNNIILDYSPVKQLQFVGQLDFAAETNARLGADSNMMATMFSGFFQGRYIFYDHFSVTGRFEFFNDPDGFLSGPYYYDGQERGLMTYGITLGFEYKPVKIGYVRAEYRYLNSSHGNYVFHNLNSDNLQAIIFTTGVRF